MLDTWSFLALALFALLFCHCIFEFINWLILRLWSLEELEAHTQRFSSSDSLSPEGRRLWLIARLGREVKELLPVALWLVKLSVIANVIRALLSLGRGLWI